MEQHLSDKYRYERKYIVQKNQLSFFISDIYNNNFIKLYDERRVNNVYFDSKNFNAVSDNIDGLSTREKIRIRWYGRIFDTSIKTLEIKIKNEFLNRKNIFDLGVYKLSDYKSISDYKGLLKNNKSKFESLYYKKLASLDPSLLNSYRRSYFFNPISQTRITIDEDLYFFSPITSVKYYEKYNIVEAKFEKNNEFINNYDNLTLTRYSKYAKGSLQTNFYRSNY